MRQRGKVKQNPGSLAVYPGDIVTSLTFVHPEIPSSPSAVIPAPEPESSAFRRFWMPDQVRHDEIQEFLEWILTCLRAGSGVFHRDPTICSEFQATAPSNGEVQMILSFHPCFTADHQIILGDRVLTREDISAMAGAAAIILPQACSLQLYRTCKGTSALLFPDYDARFHYPGKIGQNRLFNEIGCRHPRTIPWGSVAEFEAAHRDMGIFPHKIPFLLKANTTHEGEGVYLIADRRSLEDSLGRLSGLEQAGSGGFISQELISGGGNVLRVVIVGRRMTCYWKRPERSGQVITSIGRDGRVDEAWRKDLQERARAEALQISSDTGINLAALDFVFPLSEPEPQPYILEINYYFGRRGLGGSENFYRLLYEAVREWLAGNGIDPRPLGLA